MLFRSHLPQWVLPSAAEDGGWETHLPAAAFAMRERAGGGAVPAPPPRLRPATGDRGHATVPTA